jgi:hypothetical protein
MCSYHYVIKSLQFCDKMARIVEFLGRKIEGGTHIDCNCHQNARFEDTESWKDDPNNMFLYGLKHALDSLFNFMKLKG